MCTIVVSVQSEEKDKEALLTDLHGQLTCSNIKLQSLEEEYQRSQLVVAELRGDLDKKTSEFMSLREQACKILYMLF